MQSQYGSFGTKFVLDEEKMIKENYKLDEIYKAIDNVAEKLTLIKTDKHTYMSRDNENDLAMAGAFVHMNLMKCDWFTENVKEWIFIDREDGNIDLKEKYNLNKKVLNMQDENLNKDIKNKHCKSIAFDFDTKAMEKYFGLGKYQKGYADFGKFMQKNGFTHEQGSVYHSIEKMDYNDIVNFVKISKNELPWLEDCVRVMEATNIGKAIE